MGFFALATGFRGFCQPINHEVWVYQLSLCHETCSSWSLDLIQGREQQQIQGLLTCLGGRCFTITNWWSKRDGMNSLVIAWNGNVQPFQHQIDLTSITNLLGRYLSSSLFTICSLRTQVCKNSGSLEVKQPLCQLNKTSGWNENFYENETNSVKTFVSSQFLHLSSAQMQVEQAVSQKPLVPGSVGVTKSWKPPKKNTDKCGGFNAGGIPAKHNSCPVTVSTCLSQPCNSTWTGLKDTNGAGSAYFANSAICHWPVGATGDSTSGCWYNLIATNGEWYLWLLIPVNQAGHRCHGILTSFLHRFKPLNRKTVERCDPEVFCRVYSMVFCHVVEDLVAASVRTNRGNVDIPRSQMIWGYVKRSINPLAAKQEAIARCHSQHWSSIRPGSRHHVTRNRAAKTLGFLTTKCLFPWNKNEQTSVEWLLGTAQWLEFLKNSCGKFLGESSCSVESRIVYCSCM